MKPGVPKGYKVSEAVLMHHDLRRQERRTELYKLRQIAEAAMDQSHPTPALRKALAALTQMRSSE